LIFSFNQQVKSHKVSFMINILRHTDFPSNRVDVKERVVILAAEAIIERISH